MTAFVTSLLLLSLAPISQDSIKLQRTFKVGEADRYQAKLSISIEVGEVDLHIKTEQRVKSVAENGEAELEGELLEIKTFIGGTEMPAPGGTEKRKTTFKVDRFGVPTATADKGGFGFSFLNFASMVGDKPLVVGQKTPVGFSDPNDPKRKGSGTVLLESVKDGEAKLVSNWEISLPERGVPLKIDMTSFVEIANGKLVKASGTASGLSTGDTQVKAIQFSIERVKS